MRCHTQFFTYSYIHSIQFLLHITIFTYILSTSVNTVQLSQFVSDNTLLCSYHCNQQVCQQMPLNLASSILSSFCVFALRSQPLGFHRQRVLLFFVLGWLWPQGFFFGYRIPLSAGTTVSKQLEPLCQIFSHPSHGCLLVYYELDYFLKLGFNVHKFDKNSILE